MNTNKIKISKWDIIVICIVFGFLIYFNATLEPSLLYIESQTLKADIRDTPEVIQIAEEINRSCINEEDIVREQLCKYLNASRFMIYNVTTRTDSYIENHLNLNNDPEFTLKYGNDCEGKAILFSDILKNIGIEPVYILKQNCYFEENETEGHYCVLSGVSGYFYFYNCYSDCDIVFIRRVV